MQETQRSLAWNAFCRYAEERRLEKPRKEVLRLAGHDNIEKEPRSIGMVLPLLWKKEETAADDYQRGRRQVDALQHTFADTMRAKPWQAYYQQGRQQVAAVEHTLEDSVRAKPLQSLLIAAGVGMFLGVLMKK